MVEWKLLSLYIALPPKDSYCEKRHVYIGNVEWAWKQDFWGFITMGFLMALQLPARNAWGNIKPNGAWAGTRKETSLNEENGQRVVNPEMLVLTISNLTKMPLCNDTYQWLKFHFRVKNADPGMYWINGLKTSPNSKSCLIFITKLSVKCSLFEKIDRMKKVSTKKKLNSPPADGGCQFPWLSFLNCWLPPKLGGGTEKFCCPPKLLGIIPPPPPPPPP